MKALIKSIGEQIKEEYYYLEEDILDQLNNAMEFHTSRIMEENIGDNDTLTENEIFDLRAVIHEIMGEIHGNFYPDPRYTDIGADIEHRLGSTIHDRLYEKEESN